MTMPIPERWTFKDEEVARGFDDHVREQLPWYDLATRVVAHIAEHYVPTRGGVIYDVGASTGNIGRAMAETIEARGARLIAVEESNEMADLYIGPGELVRKDACDVEYEDFDLAVLFLTLMFIPPYRRAHLIANLVSRVRPGGAIVVFDKIVPSSGYPSSILWRMTLKEKLRGGATPADVTRKELALAGVQRPLNPRELPEGAHNVFRFGDFSGWIIEKEPSR